MSNYAEQGRLIRAGILTADTEAVITKYLIDKPLDRSSIEQVLIEEAIDVFEGCARTNLLSLKDAYNVLSNIHLDVPTNLQIYVKELRARIKTDLGLIKKILLSPKNLAIPSCYSNLIEKYMQQSDNESINDKAAVALQYIKNDCPVFSDKFELFYQHCYPSGTELDAILILASLEKNVKYSVPDPSIAKLYKHIPELEVAMAKCSLKNLYDYYDTATALKILYDNHTIDRYHGFYIGPDQENLDLLAKNYIPCSVTIEQLAALAQSNDNVALKEICYQAGLLEDYRKLTFANNSTHTFEYRVRILHNRSETFTLGPRERKVFTNLRALRISHISVQIYSENGLFAERQYLDINAYVAIYGDFKLEVYYEPDASLDAETPTDAMIKQVADELMKEFKAIKLRYPSISYDAFVGSLGIKFDQVEYAGYFVSKLKSFMRPLQLKRTLDILLGE